MPTKSVFFSIYTKKQDIITFSFSKKRCFLFTRPHPRSTLFTPFQGRNLGGGWRWGRAPPHAFQTLAKDMSLN